MKPKLPSILLMMLAGWINFVRQARPEWLLKFDPKAVFKRVYDF